MPREIVLGNGELLVNFDANLFLRDLYWPYVGWANHVGGYKCRVGVWVGAENAPGGGRFAWLDDGWERALAYVPDTLVTHCALTHRGLGVTLHVCQAVLHDRPVLLQKWTVENLTDAAIEARPFFSHDFRIDESDIGDTSYYDPFLDALVHYKRDKYFLTAGVGDDGEGITQWACGEKAFRGAEGTWRDAEDGHLSMNAIAQGSVDSTIGYALHIPPRGAATLRTWLCVGDRREAVETLQTELLAHGFDALLDATETHGRRFSRARHTDWERLPDAVADLYTRSLLVVRTQIDKRGAILASNDSDIMETARAHYSYLWPRDGALVCAALDAVGARALTRPFFQFCARVLPAERGALMHKYGPDGSVGASWHPWLSPGGVPEIPIQEDGTALVVWAFARHVAAHGWDDETRSLYDAFLHPAAAFLADFRDPETHLPLPSWDLWEERRGIHIYTTAAVIAALESASKLAGELGKTKEESAWKTAAEDVKAALLTHFWDEQTEHFARMVTVGENGVTRDITADASSAAVFALGVLPPDDPKVVATMQALGRKLWVKTATGGLARYERDYYFRVSEDFDAIPGNPWVICTLWLADWYVATAKTPADLKSALDLLEWAAKCASETGMLPEQVHPFTRAPLSVAPLTWSHAQFITTTTAYLNKLAALEG